MNDYEVESVLLAGSLIAAFLVSLVIFMVVKIHRQEKRHRKEMEKYKDRV